LVLLAAAAIVGLGVMRLRRRDDPALRAWLRLIAIAVVTIAAAYFMFLGSNLHPRDPGIDMRTNMLAGAAYCVLVYAILATGFCLLLRSWSAATAVTLVAAIALGVAYAVRTRDDATTWERSAALQTVVLAAVDRELRPLPEGSTVLSFGFPAQAGPEVPIFDKSWDLTGAVRLRADDPTLDAYPIYEGVAVRCQGKAVIVDGPGNYGTARHRYGKVYFLDATDRKARRIRSPDGCRGALRSFRPGPLRA
jgi:hypothetical protein